MPLLNFGSGFLTTQEPKVKFFWGKIGKPHNNLAENSWQLVKTLLLMEKILHQLICSLSDYLQIFIHPRWCRISSINSTTFNGFLAITEIPSQRDKKSMFVSQDESSSDLQLHGSEFVQIDLPELTPHVELLRGNHVMIVARIVVEFCEWESLGLHLKPCFVGYMWSENFSPHLFTSSLPRSRS